MSTDTAEGRATSAAAKGSFPTGVTIVTGIADGVPFGTTVSAFTALGANHVAMWVLEDASIHDRLYASTVIGLSVLGADQKALAGQFATHGIDRFAGIDWQSGANGAPMLPDVLAAYELDVTERHSIGGFTLFYSTVTSARGRDGHPLVWWRSEFWNGGGLTPR
ncbi:hypothetical protein GTV32_17485 [Gordonia sp. SID5947]|uniref:flavin reductase family protein n=1 Tax=Gordonia sp. SID5947 TaxID=2690315 RepID=UPI001370A28A|nr:flavin reductase family protein [Gordonia sp. SID5947]MYR07979.1 hypothetical protein [Gordonia sp. SID5947]